MEYEWHNNSVLLIHNLMPEPREIRFRLRSKSKGEGDQLINLLSDDHSHADEGGPIARGGWNAGEQATHVIWEERLPTHSTSRRGGRPKDARIRLTGRSASARKTRCPSAQDKRLPSRSSSGGSGMGGGCVSIAAEVGVSEATIRARYHRLCQDNILQVTGVTNPLGLGFDAIAMVGIRTNGPPEPVADEASYTFNVAVGKARSQSLGALPTRALSAEEIGKHARNHFTGAMIGLYATGNGRLSTAPADFDWFAYTPVEK